jgi:hypothetical protein
MLLCIKKTFFPSSFLLIIFIDSSMVKPPWCTVGMQLYKYGTSWGVLAFVCDAIASNSALLLLHCASQLATDFSALTYPTYMSFHPSVVWHFFIVQAIELVRSGSFKRLIFMYLVL